MADIWETLSKGMKMLAWEGSERWEWIRKPVPLLRRGKIVVQNPDAVQPMLDTFWCSLFRCHHLFLSLGALWHYCPDIVYSTYSLEVKKNHKQPTEVWHIIRHAVNKKFTHAVEQQIRIHKDERESKDKAKTLMGRQHSLNSMEDNLQNKIQLDSECVWNTEENGCAVKRNDYTLSIL